MSSTSNPRLYFDIIIVLILLCFTWYKRADLSKPIIILSGIKGALIIIFVSLVLLVIASFNYLPNGTFSISSDFLFYKTNGSMGLRYIRSFGYLLLAFGSFVLALNLFGLNKQTKSN